MSIEMTSGPAARVEGTRNHEEMLDPPLMTRIGVVPCRDIFAILTADRSIPQFAWADPESGLRLVGLGEADAIVARNETESWEAIDECRLRLTRIATPAGGAGVARYFGGIAFDPDTPSHPAWSAGWPARFVLPRVILQQRDGAESATVAITDRSSDDEGDRQRREIESLGQHLRADTPSTERESTPRLRMLELEGARDRWIESVQRALDEIETEKIRKIVLSRDIVLEAEEPVDPTRLFQTIARKKPHGLQFLLRFDLESAFLGATPERLMAQHGIELRCDCLAGTAPRGSSSEEDALLATSLLRSEKDLREHRFVLDGIVEALLPFARWLEHPSTPTILSLPRLQHLSSPIHGALREKERLGHLLRRLHPTPAVGGEPRQGAYRLIREIERRPRGWYAGVVGWIAEDQADLAVGIRSAMVQDRRVTVVGGAGIVRGSDPAAEFDETTRKAASFLSLFASEVC